MTNHSWTLSHVPQQDEAKITGIRGPILFITCINYLKINVPETKITLFADDTSAVIQATGEDQM